ncbi:pirin family protein [Inhella gelatinilytica]|uniref:Pirin family protein n=1 Tax=Inhella gelatinilytica TaxID=2795030 RepID=A0A931IT87_9BURK|nr:pirin family protein [Inhella gelatinilytica]MBH9552322.1 pirin family protein [Inhella gelatinilytica]
MLTPRLAQDRGHADHGWLKTAHSFSFADYHDPAHMQFGPLRVLNDDRIAPGMGFGTHGHKNMEIVSYVLSGALAHKDSMGNTSSIHPGEVQRMSAGTGVLHSEYNHNASEETHFLQIWILPATPGGAPGYEQRAFDWAERRGRFRLVASPSGADGSVRLQQDVKLYSGLFDGNDEGQTLALDPQRLYYVHVAKGALSVNGLPLRAGDGLRVQAESQLSFDAGKSAEVLLFDMIDL